MSPRMVPPMSRPAPVMNLASGDARNTIACATSSGWPMPIGICRSSRKRFDGRLAIDAVVGDELIDDAARPRPHARPDRAGQHRVDADRRRVLLGERLGQIEQAGLARAVVDERRLRLLGEVGSGVHDRRDPGAAIFGTSARAACAPMPIRLTLNDAFPALVGDVLERRRVADAEVVDQDVRRPAERLEHVCHRVVDARPRSRDPRRPCRATGWSSRRSAASSLVRDDDAARLRAVRRSAVAAPMPCAPAATNASLPAIR